MTCQSGKSSGSFGQQMVDQTPRFSNHRVKDRKHGTVRNDLRKKKKPKYV